MIKIPEMTFNSVEEMEVGLNAILAMAKVNTTLVKTKEQLFIEEFNKGNIDFVGEYPMTKIQTIKALRETAHRYHDIQFGLKDAKDIIDALPPTHKHYRHSI